ncbi:MAG: DNA-directed RNA polymerase subunit delta [Bacilli bacterium]|nr:DNA-directed RNA polymerase subunit delta [Bacilli bacterium]
MTTKKSMVTVAYEVMSKKKKAVEFLKLYDEISQTLGFDEEARAKNISSFYTQLILDGRFVTLGENTWDLRSRHTFDKVHIDMNEIYVEEDEEIIDEIDEESIDEFDENSNEEDGENENTRSNDLVGMHIVKEDDE